MRVVPCILYVGCIWPVPCMLYVGCIWTIPCMLYVGRCTVTLHQGQDSYFHGVVELINN